MANPFLFVALLYCIKKSYETRAFRPWGVVALLVFLATLWEGLAPAALAG